jgi:hypothetical protein
MATGSTAEKTYNGWANYETWAVALWIDNDESLSDERDQRVQIVWNLSEEDNARQTRLTGVTFTRSEHARLDLAEELKDWIEEMRPEGGASLWTDLLSAALSEIDWMEIADNWLSEMDGYVPRESQ